jgi:outer membrane protein OmpA-like peptidoglycan-associated protein
MTAPGYAHRSGDVGGATAQSSAFVRHALVAGLLLLGVGDLAAIDLVLLPRYLGGATRSGPVLPAPFSAKTPRPELSPAPLPTNQPAPAAARIVESTAPPPTEVAPAEAVPPPAEPPPAAEPATSGFPNLLFARNTSWLSPMARETLTQVAAILAEQPGRRVVISGHTDAAGPEELNRALSVERARRCARWLEGRGVDPARMDIQGFGSTRPLGGDHSGDPSMAAQARNRRVEIELR